MLPVDPRTATFRLRFKSICWPMLIKPLAPAITGRFDPFIKQADRIRRRLRNTAKLIKHGDEVSWEPLLPLISTDFRDWSGNPQRQSLPSRCSLCIICGLLVRRVNPHRCQHFRYRHFGAGIPMPAYRGLQFVFSRVAHLQWLMRTSRTSGRIPVGIPLQGILC